MDTAIYAQVGIIGNESVIQIDVVFTNMKVSFFLVCLSLRSYFVFLPSQFTEKRSAPSLFPTITSLHKGIGCETLF